MHGSMSWLLFDFLYFWQKVRIVIENLKVFCIINIVTFLTLQDQHQEPSELKSKTHNRKWCLFRWNLKAFELSFTYIHHSLASLSILFKQKSLSFVLASHFNVFVWHIFIFCPIARDQPWRCMYFGAKLASIAAIFISNPTSLHGEEYQPLFYP